MAEKQETIAGIIAEMRALSNPISDGIIAINGRSIADRLEAAWKRELATAKKSLVVGDAAKLREALEMMNTLFEQGAICTSYANSAEEMEQIEELYRKTKAALTELPRNCDVGTAEEQIERWQAFCGRYDDDCTGCPCDDTACVSYTDCFARWAQMPYEKGGAK